MHNAIKAVQPCMPLHILLYCPHASTKHSLHNDINSLQPCMRLLMLLCSLCIAPKHSMHNAIKALHTKNLPLRIWGSGPLLPYFLPPPLTSNVPSFGSSNAVAHSNTMPSLLHTYHTLLPYVIPSSSCNSLFPYNTFLLFEANSSFIIHIPVNIRSFLPENSMYISSAQKRVKGGLFIYLFFSNILLLIELLSKRKLSDHFRGHIRIAGNFAQLVALVLTSSPLQLFLAKQSNAAHMILNIISYYFYIILPFLEGVQQGTRPLWLCEPSLAVRTLFGYLNPLWLCNPPEIGCFSGWVVEPICVFFFINLFGVQIETNLMIIIFFTRIFRVNNSMVKCNKYPFLGGVIIYFLFLDLFHMWEKKHKFTKIHFFAIRKKKTFRKPGVVPNILKYFFLRQCLAVGRVLNPLFLYHSLWLFLSKLVFLFIIFHVDIEFLFYNFVRIQKFLRIMCPGLFSKHCYILRLRSNSELQLFPVLFLLFSLFCNFKKAQKKLNGSCSDSKSRISRGLQILRVSKMDKEENKLSICSTAKQLAQLPAVDMQHAPAKLSSKLHLCACVDILAQSPCSMHSDSASKLGLINFGERCRQQEWERNYSRRHSGDLTSGDSNPGSVGARHLLSLHQQTSETYQTGAEELKRNRDLGREDERMRETRYSTQERTKGRMIVEKRKKTEA
ncbi:hypothetical protein VP01_453g4 [Puccinia sorghi]|uniref:Uncharacterized protein n=1 Tax=Puccinia sorghi TaxID=27349 RepID=A0A0L6UPN5_9BASI|nr:hypothetical protein VP01_453g4 [Puccinia sorghi]